VNLLPVLIGDSALGKPESPLRSDEEKTMKSRTWMWMIAVYLLAALATPVGMAAQEDPSQDHQHHKYKLIDMGTFGGPASYTSVSVGGAGTTFLNNRGMVSGGADTPTSDPYAPNCFNPDCFVSHTFRWQEGVLTDLGALAGVNSSAAVGMNARGWIAGFSENGAIDPLTQFPESRAVLWIDDRMIDLGTLGGYESAGLAVNNQGQVTGFATNSTPDQFSGFGTQVRVFLWKRGVMRDLGTLGGPDSPPLGGTFINESGQIAGCSFTNSIPNPVTGIPTADPFLWDNSTMTDLGTLGGTVGSPSSLNNRGQVAGTSNLAGDLTAHPFLWDSRKGLTDLGTLGGDNGQASWVNDAGDVVGKADLPGSQIHDAFLWKHGVMTDLGNLGQTSFAFAINSRDQVVGHSNSRAFLWENRGPMIDLNTLIPSNSSLLLTDAQGINERGEIGGLGVPAGCQPADVATCGHAYLLIPCDEKHLGQCEDYSMVEVPTPQPSAPAATVKRESESPVGPLYQLRNHLVHGYHIPGQPPSSRD
jgi:probable HAF family extracellular repeat protein